MKKKGDSWHRVGALALWLLSSERSDFARRDPKRY